MSIFSIGNVWQKKTLTNRRRKMILVVCLLVNFFSLSLTTSNLQLISCNSLTLSSPCRVCVKYILDFENGLISCLGEIKVCLGSHYHRYDFIQPHRTNIWMLECHLWVRSACHFAYHSNGHRTHIIRSIGFYSGISPDNGWKISCGRRKKNIQHVFGGENVRACWLRKIIIDVLFSVMRSGYKIWC